MALDKNKKQANPQRLEKILASQAKPALRFINKNGKSVDQLKVANLVDSIEPRRPIGTIDLKTQTIRVDADRDGKATPAEVRDYSGDMVIRQGAVILGEEIGFQVLSAPELYPENSDDHFFVEYENPALAGKGSIEMDLKTQTSDPTQSSYQDSSKIKLYEVPGKPGTFRTKELILVSSQVFDQHRVNGQPDNSPEDQTFLAELGSKVTVSYRDETLGQTLNVEASVPPEKVLEIQPIIYKDKNGNPIATEQDIARHLQSIREHFAQASILVVAKKPLILDLSLDIDITKGLSQKEMVMLAMESSGDYSPDEGIRMILVGGEHAYIEGDQNVYGIEAYAFGVGLTGGQGSYRNINNSLFIGIGNENRNVPANIAAHESVHILIGKQKVFGHDDGGHFNTSSLSYSDFSHGTLGEIYDSLPPLDKLNLMFVAPLARDTTIDGQHQLTPEQIEVMLKSPILKDPGTYYQQTQTSPAPSVKP
ncbi:MAG: hypothetical protein K1X66_00730 [Verrucomicrobiae bacterium]|nr:hypothetical protein [Verrucomicrobiae bacterium]